MTIQEARDYNVGIEDANKRMTSVEAKKQELGVHFEPEMMNNPFDAADLVFHQDRVESALKEDLKPVVNNGNELWYDVYNPGHRYAIGSDVSQGIGRDNSASVGLNLKSNSICSQNCGTRK